MITEQAIVTRCNGRQVELELLRSSACGNCELSKGCGTGALGRLLGRRSRPLVIETDQRVQAGDTVELGLSESALVKASLVAYGFPLLGMIVTGMLASFAEFSEALIVILAGIGFVIGYKISGHYTSTLEENGLTPYILRMRVNFDSQSES